MRGMSLFTPVSVTQSLCFLLFVEDTDCCFLNLHLYSYIPEARSLVAAFERAPRFPWVLIRHLFPVPSSLLFHHRALAQSLPLHFFMGFFFPFRFNSPQSSNYCFLHFFPSVHFRLKSNPLRSTASFFSTSSFHPHFSHSSLFSRLLSIHPPFHIHPLSRGFHSITTDFTSFATSSPSPPSVEQMKNTTLKRPFPPMFSACLLQNSRAS